MTAAPGAPIRIANCSGFFGDRPSGALEMVEGGPIDVLTGDWLAELTMLILSRIRAKQAKGGFARTFVSQMEQVMGTCLDQGIKVVSNAGGLDPDGCADAVQEVADRLGLSPTIAYIDGDDLMPRIVELAESGALTPFGSATGLGDPTRFLTANAYLGCFGIVDALTKGADIVITGRVTDAAVTCGPAAWHHGWKRDDFDQLAGGVVAGHIIECSAQATGGNYSFFHEIEGHTVVGGGARFGFPWAEVAADGSLLRRIAPDTTVLSHPFHSGEELLAHTRRKGLSIAQVMRANERHWRDDKAIDAGLLAIWDVMQRCVERGLRSEGTLPGGLKVRRRAAEWHRKLAAASGPSDPLAVLDWVNLFALAVNEENAAGGRVVTGGPGSIGMRFHSLAAGVPVCAMATVPCASAMTSRGGSRMARRSPAPSRARRWRTWPTRRGTAG